MSVRLIPLADWQKQLTDIGCYPQAGLGPANTGYWWRLPWPGPPFVVSTEDDGSMDSWALAKLLIGIYAAAPAGWQPPTRVTEDEGDDDGEYDH